MIRVLALLFSLTIASLAQDAPKPPLDPAVVARQLYLLSDRSWSGAGGYSIYGDGSVHFSVTLKQGSFNQYLTGSGSTPEAALEDLKRKSDLIAQRLVPEAEQAKVKTLSLIEGIKAILLGGKTSQ